MAPMMSLSSLKLTSFSGISHNSSINSPVTVPFSTQMASPWRPNIPSNTTSHLEHQTHHCQLGEVRESEKVLNASFKEHWQCENSKEVVTKNPVVCGREIRQILWVRYDDSVHSQVLFAVSAGHEWNPCLGQHYTHGNYVDLLFGIKAWKAQWWTVCRWRCDICRGYEYHLGRLVDFTTGDIPSLYRLLVLLKFTMLKITLWNNKNR